MLEVMNKIVEMSVQASFVICMIIVLRFIFIKLNIPKRLIYVLWAIPLFRLICPAAIASSFSVVPFVDGSYGGENGAWKWDVRFPFGGGIGSSHSMSTWEKPVDNGIVTGTNALSGTGTNVVNGTGAVVGVGGDSVIVGAGGDSTIAGVGSELAGDVAAGLTPMSVFLLVWVIGLATLLCYTVISTLHFRRKLVGSVHLEKNYYRADHIQTPFVLGIFRPKIYLPSTLSDQDAAMIIQHEEMHIQRRDHIVKFVAYIVTCVYWFNPLVWLMYGLFCRDMESAVDEKVISAYDIEARQTYATLLLALNTDRKHLLAAPLAFGEGNVKGRIKSVVKYKKPVTILVIIAVVVAIVVALGLVTSQKYVIPTGAEAEVKASSYGEMIQGDENFLSSEDEDALIDLLRTSKLQWTFSTSMSGISDDYYDVMILIDGNMGYLTVDEDTAYFQMDNKIYTVNSREEIFALLDGAAPVNTAGGSQAFPDDVPYRKTNSVMLTHVETSDRGSTYRVSTQMNGVSLKYLSEDVSDAIAEYWDRYNSMSEEDRQSAMANVTKEFDTWDDCVTFVGFSMINPLEDLEDLQPEEWHGLDLAYGGKHKHCQINCHGSETSYFEAVYTHTSYSKDDIKVALNATIYGFVPDGFQMGTSFNSLATVVPEDIQLSNGGNAVLVQVTEVGEAPKVYVHFAINDVLYRLKVSSESRDCEELAAYAKELLALFDPGVASNMGASVGQDLLLDRVYEESLEDIYQFGCDFVQYFISTVSNKYTMVSFDKFVDYDKYMDLACYIELLQQYTVRQIVAGVAPMQYDGGVEFSPGVDVVELGAHRYKVIVSFDIEGTVSEVHMLVRYQNGEPKIENVCFDQKDSVDELVIGSLEKHDITNSEKWLDATWTAKVLDDLYAYGDKLMEWIEEDGTPYYAGRCDYYQGEDGMWVCNGNKYYYRLILGGANVQGDPALYGSVYVVLSNDLNITYNRAFMASGFSSSMSDYFDPSYARVVDHQSYDRSMTEPQVFTYNGEDPIMRAICNYMVAADYRTNKEYGNVQIPAPMILKIDDSDPSDIKVWGNFWSHTYKLEGQTLVSNGGGEWPCLMHLAKYDNQYVITRIDRVGDGSYYEKDLKEICKGQPGLFEEFEKTHGPDNEAREAVRQEFLRSYISYYAMDVTAYQDYGWDPVKLN